MAINEVEKDGVKMLEYRFQPKMPDGTPIGGEQVVYGATHEELMDKSADNYNNLYNKNRELLRIEKLAGKAPEGSAQAPAPIRFNPRPLTAQERMQLARDMSNPETIDSALDLALEAKFGVKPDKMSESVNRNQERAEAIYTAQQAAAWRDDHPEFYPSEKNRLDLCNWVNNRNMPFTYESLQKAYEDLLPALEVAPPSVQRTDSNASSATPDSRITETVSGSAQRQTATPTLPTTVSRKTGTTRGSTKKEGVSAEQYYRMDNHQRRKFLKENPNWSVS
jgi:hypothetical protein